MPISRDARTDRRRRLLRDSGDNDAQTVGTSRRTGRKSDAEGGPPDSPGAKRKAGYSQDVRKACSQRLVQLIPVRRRSYAAVCLISLFIPGLLLAMHYWIHVTGQLPWWRHPLAVALDVGHPRSIAAWLSSQLWLLCLAATVLTFQLRRHKLDDYNGEYRLWFWLVLTCLIASVDATTSITTLFAQALDRWTQVNLGWSGPAVVDSTLGVMIGMLGLRMCSELKAVPLSLVFWLAGLVSWAGSAALARPELQLEMSAPIRYWLISVLWLGGLTLIWLSALTYLRSIYVEAQQRFLLRGPLASVRAPLRQRLRESIPAMPQFMRRVSGDRAAETSLDGTAGSQKARRWGRRAKSSQADSPLRSPSPPAASSHDARSQEEAVDKTGKRPEGEKSSGWKGWLRRAKDDDQAGEYRKVNADGESTPDRRAERAAAKELKATQRTQDRAARLAEKNKRIADAGEPKARRRWLAKLSLPKLPAMARWKSSKSDAVETPRPKASREASSDNSPSDKPSGVWSKLKVPSIRLSALRLQPPGETDSPKRPTAAPQPMRPVSENRILPNTTPNHLDSFDDEDDNDNGSDARPLSKAERKRMRRNQQQNRRSA